MSLQEEKASSQNGIHFTYKKDADMHSLCQGDVLLITEELKAVLKEIHPYFLHEQYKYFMVLSQSCDLVRRNGKNCKTPYITLAAVKNYDAFLEKKLIDGKMAENVRGLLLMEEKKKEKAYQFIERIYNNTEPEYFFLYKEDKLVFNESAIVYLRVSIALKSNEHYEKCLNAKILELTDEFKAKLGWLVGNMYSRVGTTDWESIKSSRQRTQMLNDELTSKFIIGSKEQLKCLKEQLENNPEQLFNHDEAVSYVSNIYVQSKYEKAIEIIGDTIQSTCKDLSEEEKQKLLNAIKSKSALKTLFP